MGIEEYKIYDVRSLLHWSRDAGLTEKRNNLCNKRAIKAPPEHVASLKTGFLSDQMWLNEI